MRFILASFLAVSICGTKLYADIDLIFEGGNFKSGIFLLCCVKRLPFSSLNFLMNCFMSFYFVEFDAIMKIGESVCSVTSSLKFKYFKYYTFYQSEFNIISNYFLKIKKLPKMVISLSCISRSLSHVVLIAIHQKLMLQILVLDDMNI